MTTDQGPIPVILTVLFISTAMAVCYYLTGSPFPDPRPFGR